LADLSGFPPAFPRSGTRDLLLSYTVGLLAAGVEAELHMFGAMPTGRIGGTAPEDLELAADSPTAPSRLPDQRMGFDGFDHR
jgi:hypothetical protein